MSNFLYKMAIKKAMSYLKKEPEKNIPKLINLVEKIRFSDEYGHYIYKIKKIMEDKDHPLRELTLSLWTDIEDNRRQIILKNLLINAGLNGSKIRKGVEDKWNHPIPKFIIIEWNDKRQNKDYFHRIFSVIQSGRELGVYGYFIRGIQSTEGMNQSLKLADQFEDTVILSSLRDNLVDKKMGQRIFEAKNFIPILEMDNNLRKEIIAKQAQYLKREKIFFGIGNLYDGNKWQDLICDSYIKWMVDIGAKFSLYLPDYDFSMIRKSMDHKNEVDVNRRISMKSKEFPLLLINLINSRYLEGQKSMTGKYYIYIDRKGWVKSAIFNSEILGDINKNDIKDILGKDFDKKHFTNH